VRYLRLVLFGVVIFAVFAVAHQSSSVFAETVAKSTSFEKTTLIEYVNQEGTNIKSIRMWLGKDDGAFTSFKTEKGWTGTKTPQGVLVFTAEQILEPGKTVKFGIKTEIQSPGINWKTIDVNGNELTTGRTEPGEQPPITRPDQNNPQDKIQKQPSNLDNAIFRIIPETPKNGDSIRIVGDGFPPNKQLGFFIDDQKLDDLGTDRSGHLLGTSKIPINKDSERVEFSLVDDQGNKKTISLRIAHKEVQIVNNKVTQLTVTQISQIVEPGQTARVSGTAKPGITITISYKDLAGNKIQEAAIPVDAQGNWSYERVIPPDAPLGSVQVEFSDGTDKITKTLSISVSKKIHVTSSATRYEPGDTMLFNGTAIPDEPIEIVINDPKGKEIFYDVLKMTGTEAINFAYPTTQASLKGTYVVLMTQGGNTEILRVGLGEQPTPQIVVKFDKLNYSTSEKAKMTIKGPAKATVSILIIDPSDKVKATDSTILGQDGSKEYLIDLSGYKSGIYSVVLKYSASRGEAVFAVGLQQGSGPITIQATKQTYQLGEGVLVLGTTSKPNVLVTLEMFDPDGKSTKRKDIFSDQKGVFNDGTFRVPSDAKQGTWTIRASSGTNYNEAKLNVVGTVEQAFVINADKLTPYHGGDTITITGTGAGKSQSGIITIYDSKNTKVDELTVNTTGAGSFQLLWIIPSSAIPGDYKISAKVSNEIAQTTFQIQ
jgi:hypothetical protein